MGFSSRDLLAESPQVSIFSKSFSDLAASGQQLYSTAHINENEEEHVHTTLTGMNPTGAARHRGLWTQEQDDALRIAVEKHGAKNWKDISLEVPGDRTHIQCLQRWSKVLKPGLVKGAWTVEEDEMLEYFIGQYPQGNWVSVAENIPGRTAKQCRERWMLVLDPSIRKDSWSAEEDEMLLYLHERHGNAWALISKQLNGRTENSAKSRFKSLERKQKRAWTLAEDAVILRAKAEEKSWEAMAKLLPNRSKHAVKMRWKYLASSAVEVPAAAPTRLQQPHSTSPQTRLVLPPVLATPSSTARVSPRDRMMDVLNDPFKPSPSSRLTSYSSSGNWGNPTKDLSVDLASNSFQNWLRSPKFELDTRMPPPVGTTTSPSRKIDGGDAMMMSFSSSFGNVPEVKKSNSSLASFGLSQTVPTFPNSPAHSFGQVLDELNFDDFDRV